MKKIIVCLQLFLMFSLPARAEMAEIPDHSAVLLFKHRDPVKQQVIRRALAYAVSRPVNLEKENFVDACEEIFLFYHVYQASSDEQVRSAIKKMLEYWIDEVLDKRSPDFDRWSHICCFLPLSIIMEELEYAPLDYRFVIRERILIEAMTYYTHSLVTHVPVWNAHFLERLGFEPSQSIRSLIDGTSLAALAVSGEEFSFLAEESLSEMYDLVHIVMPFGMLGGSCDFSLFSPGEMAVLKRTLRKGLAEYLKKDKVDIVAELVVCCTMIGDTDFDDFRKALDYIVEKQLPAGHFGSIRRMIYLGKHPYRHGVFSSVWALILAD